MYQLDFEKQITDLEQKINELRHMSSSNGVNIIEEISTLQGKVDKLLKQTSSKLTPWQKVQVARHPERPHFLEYVHELVEDFLEMAGDRVFGEDAAIIGGMGRFRGQTVMIIGQEKGRETETRIKHNFGMVRPEGYRKAQRLMQMAEQFDIPIITLVDTPGAYPGVDAEERGQSQAIAQSMDVSLSVKVPLISVIVGEGASGGAIAIAAANTVMMLEHSFYAIISPEGCASILWRSGDKKQEAAEAQKLTAQDLLKLKIIDKIIPEPLGGAHRDPRGTIMNVGDAIEKELKLLKKISGKELVNLRRQKFLNMGRSLN
jgi:acetyl-CoA carboxylase carboxyl transferase subunit alpha